MSINTSIKLRPGLKPRLQALAKERRVSVNQLINEAIEEYLEREERRIAFVKSAKERWEHYRLTGERISDEEADQWIERLLHGEDADAQ